MESLDPECTPLKHRYDSCFNLWFEGYLQPALDSRSSEIISARLQASTSSSASSTSSLDLTASDTRVEDKAITPPTRKPLITSWANALRPRTVLTNNLDTETSVSEADASDAQHGTPREAFKIDTRGKTRSQIKAEEYEKACGGYWRDYQSCLKKAIAQNTSLSTLLEQARDEHPLKSQDGLGGTAWDPQQRES